MHISKFARLCTRVLECHVCQWIWPDLVSLGCPCGWINNKLKKERFVEACRFLDTLLRPCESCIYKALVVRPT